MFSESWGPYIVPVAVFAWRGHRRTCSDDRVGSEAPYPVRAAHGHGAARHVRRTDRSALEIHQGTTEEDQRPGTPCAASPMRAAPALFWSPSASAWPSSALCLPPFFKPARSSSSPPAASFPWPSASASSSTTACRSANSPASASKSPPTLPPATRPTRIRPLEFTRLICHPERSLPQSYRGRRSRRTPTISDQPQPSEPFFQKSCRVPHPSRTPAIGVPGDRSCSPGAPSIAPANPPH